LSAGLQIVADSIAKQVLGIDIRDCSVNVEDFQLQSAPSAAAAAAAADDNDDDDDDDTAAGSGAAAGNNAHSNMDCTYDSPSSASQASVGFSCGDTCGKVRGLIAHCHVRQCQIGMLSRDGSAIAITSCTVSRCGDAGIISRDGSSSVITDCRVSRCAIGAVLQAVAGAAAVGLNVTACDLGVLVHGAGRGAVESAVIRRCTKGLFIAKGGGDVKLKNVKISSGTTGVVAGATNTLLGFRVEDCTDEGYLIQRSGRVVMQDCSAIACGIGCRVLGNATCSSCEWQRCVSGFIR
jgi:hypothetical protein